VYEDQAFITKVSLHEPVYVSNRCWDRYRLHSESIVAKVTAAGQFLAARRFYFDWLSDYLTQQGLDDPRILRRIRRTRWACRHPFLAGMARPARHWWRPPFRRDDDRKSARIKTTSPNVAPAQS
jgi:hypothetical protein